MHPFLAVLIAMSPQAAPAQERPPETPVFRTLAQQVTIDGQARFRAEYRDPISYTNTPASMESDDIYIERLRINFKFVVTDDIDVFLQPQDQRTFGDEASVLSDETNMDLHQGYAEVRKLLGEPLSIKIGRQEIQYGDQRLVSPLDWSNIARAWDGVKVRYAPAGVWIDGFYTVIKEGAAAGEDQDFFGLYGSYVDVADHEFDLYALGRQFKDNAFTDERGNVGDLRDTTYGARLKGKALGFDYTLEGMYQNGHFAKDDISAHAYAGTLGYTFDLPWKPRLGIEYTFAGGDEDPTDGERGTFDPLYPFGHFYQGFADVFAFKNGRDLAVYLKLVPLENLSVHLDFHSFRLAEARDAWYNFAGAPLRRDVTGTADESVGTELDLHARLSVGKNVKFWAGWSRFFAGDFVEETPGTERDMNWLFLQMTVDF